MYPYEGMVLVDPTAHAEDPENVESGVKTLLEKHGAKVHQLQRWDERKLAYEIKGHKRGVYLLAYLEMPGENIDAFRKEAAITEMILRQMLIRLETDIPTHLERAAQYDEKTSKDAEARRTDRGSDFGPPAPGGEASPV
ncbi:MAG: 30S ribosomal protein S6 [Planctomycetota bacterium]|jgi:small subunit ribosomal protein S6|nr:30S ribosomal protein S6 [Planctomycetota bacterium]